MIATIVHFLKILVFSNLLIGFSAGGYAAGWAKYIGVNNWIYYGFFSFFAAVALYNLDKLWKIQWVSEPSDWLLWIGKHRITLWCLTILFGILAICLLIWNIELKNISAIIVLGSTGIIGVLYSIPLPFIRLRNIPGIKAILIACVWVFFLAGFPAINEGIVLTHPNLIFGSMFTFFLAITIPFDIRDIEKDPEELKTIPQRFGIPKAKVLSYIILVISLLFAIFSYNTWVNLYLTVISIILGFLISFADTNARWWLYALIDCCVLLSGMVFLLIK
jgi:hypothetical protein